MNGLFDRGGWACCCVAPLCVALLMGSFVDAAEDDPRVLRDITYVERESGPVKLDLYLPDHGEEEVPLVVWIHGGGWQAGERHPNPLADLTGEAYAVASISYRYSTVEPHPAQVHDCQAAIRWLRKHADEYGYDGERIGVVGGSAGGHLVGMLATTADASQMVEPGLSEEDAAIPVGVQAAVSFAGPMDLILITQGEPHDLVLPLLRDLLGGPASEREAEARHASPITYVDAEAAPLLLIQGEADDLVPPNQAEVMHEAMQEAGAHSELLLLEGVGHDAGLLDADTRRRMKNFLVKHLRH